MLGQSISGSTIKEFSVESSIRGITFEAAIAQQYAQFRLLKNYSKSEEYKFIKDTDYRQNTINYYSSMISGDDSDFDSNNKLPSHFKAPNIYDTACLVAATCSKTMKYDSFCRQVLNDTDSSASEVYDSIIDSFYDRYL